MIHLLYIRGVSAWPGITEDTCVKSIMSMQVESWQVHLYISQDITTLAAPPSDCSNLVGSPPSATPEVHNLLGYVNATYPVSVLACMHHTGLYDFGGKRVVSEGL